MGARDLEPALRTLARHQHVRDRGTPRVSTLLGEPEAGGSLWRDWLRGEGREEDAALAFVQPHDGDARWLSAVAAAALTTASERPGRPIAIAVRPELLAIWLATRTDRTAAFVAEGICPVVAEAEARVPAADTSVLSPAPANIAAPSSVAPSAAAPPSPSSAAAPPSPSSAAAPSYPATTTSAQARSLAEQAMLDALEADAATAGRFRLNQAVSFAFGARAAEVDLLSRVDDLAIEIDGYHHFTDAEHYRRDRRKDLLLQAHGYLVLRFLAEDVLADPRAAVGAVIELLGVRRGRLERQRRA